MLVLYVVYVEGCVVKVRTEGYVIFWQETGSTGVTTVEFLAKIVSIHSTFLVLDPAVLSLSKYFNNDDINKMSNFLITIY